MATTFPGMMLAVAGLGLLFLAGSTSYRYVRRKMKYETWWAVHLYTYLAVALSIPHQILTGAPFMGHPLATAWWLDALVRDRRRRHRLPLGPADRAQPAAQGDGPLRRGRSARRGLRDHGGPAPRQARGVGRPVPALALPEARHVVAGAPVLAVGGADREPDADHRQGPRRPQRLAGRPSSRGRAWPSKAPTEPSPTTRGTPTACVLVAAGVGVTPVRALLEDLPRHVDVVAILRGRQPARPGPARRARPPGGRARRAAPRARRAALARPPRRGQASPSSCPTSPTGTCTSAAPAASCRASSPPPARWASAASASTTRTSPSRRRDQTRPREET